MFIPQAADRLYWECVEGAVGFENVDRAAFELAIKQEGRRREDLDPERAEWQARFIALGRLAAERAEAHLDDELREDAYRWKEADADGRLAICERLFRAFRFTHTAAGSADELIEAAVHDMRNQPVERVYPNRFSLEAETESVSPNCFGKGLLLLGFSRLCRADILGSTPIVASAEYSSQARKNAALKLRCEAFRLGIPITDSLANYFEMIDAQVYIHTNRPPAFHQGALFRLDEKRWCLVDPNAGFFGEVEDGGEVNAIYRELREADAARPGEIRRLDTRARSREHVATGAADSDVVLGWLSRLWTGPIHTLADAKAALRRIGEKSALELLLSAKKIVSASDAIQVRDAKITGTTGIADDAFKRTFPPADRTEQREIAAGLALLFARMEDESVCGFQAIVEWNDGEAAAADREASIIETIREQFVRLMNALIGLGIDRADVALAGARRILHPGLELYLPDFTAGLWILAHTNGVVYRSEELHRFLGQFSTEEFLQLGIASDCLIHPDGYSREAVRSALATLRSHDLHSVRMNQQLERIERMLQEG